ncbi:MAG: low-specificity L-threonine aldolase [Anaerolineaceae bacterium]|nr:low-specificity L-threonine aldolase [Anaerolineaceae bacterium]
MKTIDLRSDTVTLPTPSMRKAMADAEVGDDVYNEDPSINALQDLAAAMLGKEAGLYIPSGTMGNLAAVLSHCNRGDETIMGNLAHTFLFEAGGVSALGGVVMHTLPNQPDGTLDLTSIRNAIRVENPHFPTSKLIILENTHNRCGGVPISTEYTKQVADIAHENGMFLHIDGARIFNAAVKLGVSAAELSVHADSITFCLSKALCAPVGSVLVGSKDFIHRANRIRKQVGGGMRQAGFIAAAGVVALEEMVDRLSEDHRRADLLADGLKQIPGISFYLNPPITTNMVFISLDDKIPLNGAQVIERLKEYGIKIGMAGPRHFRLVTHYWISDDDISFTVQKLKEILQ